MPFFTSSIKNSHHKPQAYETFVQPIGLRALSLESIRVNYSALEATWDEALEVCSQSEVKARINGVQLKMKDFDFCLALLGEQILKHTDNLSKTLQATAMSAVEAYSVSKLCMFSRKFKHMMILTCFGNLQKPHKNSLEVKDPALPHARKRPRCYEDGAAEPYHPPDVKQHYKQIYFQSVDSAIATIENRFQQKDYKTYSTLEQLIIKAATKKDCLQELNEVVSFYASDFSKSELQTQLELLGQMKIAVSGRHLQFCDIHKCFQSLPPGQLSLLSQVSLLVKLITLMPVTNAVSERSASALCHVI